MVYLWRLTVSCNLVICYIIDAFLTTISLNLTHILIFMLFVLWSLDVVQKTENAKFLYQHTASFWIFKFKRTHLIWLGSARLEWLGLDYFGLCWIRLLG